MANVSKVCPICCITYSANETRLKHDRETTCSRECSYKYRAKIASEKLKDKVPNKTSFKKGMTPWNKKQKHKLICLCCDKKFEIADWQLKRGQKYCSKICADKLKTYKNLFEKGHPDLVPSESRGHSEATKEKLKKINRANIRRGENSPNWKGGKRSERKKAMGTFEYRDWRKAVFEKDNYTCVSCNSKGIYVEADHIKPWCAFPKLRFDVTNGRTLCRPCHIKQDTHGRKALKYMELRNE